MTRSLYVKIKEIEENKLKQEEENKINNITVIGPEVKFLSAAPSSNQKQSSGPGLEGPVAI